MSTERADNPTNGPAAGVPSPSRHQHLPSDLLLEIAARSDATTVIRCTAASKPLCQRRRLRPRPPPGRLLRSYQLEHDGGAVAVTSPRVRLDAATLAVDSDWLPESSRDGLLLRRDVREKKLINDRVYLTSRLVLRVCDTSTGRVVAASLPQATALKYYVGHVVRAKSYATALLPDRERGAAFEVVDMDMHLRVQTFSSEAGEWGAARAVHPASARPWVFGQRDAPCGAAVVGRNVHWLCFRAAEVELLRGCRLSGTGGGADPYCYEMHKALLLHVAAGGTWPEMVAAEADAVTVWTLDYAAAGEGSDARWSRRAVIGRQAIAAQLGTAGWDVLQGAIKLEGLGERSGTVLLSTTRFWGLAQLSLVTGQRGD
ncbi:unnamed protein product [Urochloa decumbens]|uniref:DUF7595 domain-containing protein n=1 Tax=Urochloa decumbens TaxID=240449 RepID=A0ABC9DR67_9POAL